MASGVRVRVTEGADGWLMMMMNGNGDVRYASLDILVGVLISMRV